MRYLSLFSHMSLKPNSQRLKKSTCYRWLIISSPFTESDSTLLYIRTVCQRCVDPAAPRSNLWSRRCSELLAQRSRNEWERRVTLKRQGEEEEEWVRVWWRGAVCRCSELQIHLWVQPQKCIMTVTEITRVAEPVSLFWGLHVSCRAAVQTVTLRGCLWRQFVDKLAFWLSDFFISVTITELNMKKKLFSISIVHTESLKVNNY